MFSASFLHSFSRHDIMVTLFHINQLCYVPNPDEKLPTVFFQHHLQKTWMFWWPTRMPSFPPLFWVRASCSVSLLFLPIRTYFPQVCMWVDAQVSTADTEIVGFLCSSFCSNYWGLLWSLKFLWLLKTTPSGPSSILSFSTFITISYVYILLFFTIVLSVFLL